MRPIFVGFVIHTGGMGQEYAENRAKRHPKGAANPIHYTLLGVDGLDQRLGSDGFLEDLAKAVFEGQRFDGR